ncbi:hypothetical protein CR513_14365, partial [Mucuna pruriens]
MHDHDTNKKQRNRTGITNGKIEKCKPIHCRNDCIDTWSCGIMDSASHNNRHGRIVMVHQRWLEHKGKPRHFKSECPNLEKEKEKEKKKSFIKKKKSLMAT